MKDIILFWRCVLAFPFGLIAETFALIALKISDGELDCDFNHLKKRK